MSQKVKYFFTNDQYSSQLLKIPLTIERFYAKM